MKLHLPKLLRNAVLSCLAAVAGIATTTLGTATFTGGVVAFALSNQQVLGVEGTVTTSIDYSYDESTNQLSGGVEVTPTEDTWYKVTDQLKHYSVKAESEGSKHNVKLSGQAGSEIYLDVVEAESLLIESGRWRIEEAGALTDAGDIYMGGGQIQFGVNQTLTNKFTIGKTEMRAEADTLSHSAFRVGDNADNIDVWLKGGLVVQYDARISFQNSGDLFVQSALTGSGNLELDGYKGSNRLLLEGDLSGYTGTIIVNSLTTVELYTAGDQTLSNVTLNGGAVASGNGNSDSRKKNIINLQVNAAGGTLRDSNRNTVWSINNLTGEGDLTWNPSGVHWAPSVLNVNGGVYTGSLTLDRTDPNGNNASRGPYQAILQVNAGAKNTFQGGVTLSGANSNSYAIMALNAANDVVKVGALNGGTYAYIYAGEAVYTGGNGSYSIGSVRPVSTIETTLELTTDGTASYKGSIAADVDILMSGEGTQYIATLEEDASRIITATNGVLKIDGLGSAARVEASGSGRVEVALGIAVVREDSYTWGNGNANFYYKAVADDYSGTEFVGNVVFTDAAIYAEGSATDVNSGVVTWFDSTGFAGDTIEIKSGVISVFDPTTGAAADFGSVEKIILNGGGLVSSCPWHHGATDPNINLDVDIEVTGTGYLRAGGSQNPITATDGSYQTVLSGALTGNGTLVKTDGGTMELAGDGSAFTGNLQVQGGALEISNVTNANALLFTGSGTGKLVVSEGGVLTTTRAQLGDTVGTDITVESGAAWNVTGGIAANTTTNSTYKDTATFLLNHYNCDTNLTIEGNFNMLNNSHFRLVNRAADKVVLTVKDGGTMNVKGVIAVSRWDIPTSGNMTLNVESGATLNLGTDGISNKNKKSSDNNYVAHNGITLNLASGATLGILEGAGSWSTERDITLPENLIVNTQGYTVSANGIGGTREGGSAGTITLSGVLTSGSITKEGDGVLMLTNADNTVGSLTINGGYAQYGGTNAINVTSAAGAGLQIAAAEGMTGMNLGTVTPGGDSLLLRVTGLEGATVDSSYTLFANGGSVPGSVQLITVGLADTLEAVYANGAITFQTIEAATSGDLTWIVDGQDNTWNADSSAKNWNKDSAAQRFVNGSSVTFGSDSSSKGETITIEGNITTNGVTVNGTGWVFAGSGGIASTGALTIADYAAVKFSTSGTVSVSAIGSSATAKLSLSGTTLTASSQNADTNLGTLSLETASLGFAFSGKSSTVSIGTLTVSGISKLETVNGGWSGVFNITALESEAVADITFSSNSAVTTTTQFNLGSTDSTQSKGLFQGDIRLVGNTSSNSWGRRSAINILNEYVAENAVIHFSDNYTNQHLGLGIVADQVKVAGLNGEVDGSNSTLNIVSGKCEGQTYDGDEVVRTLVIGTKAGDAWSTNAGVTDHLNLIKKGSGSQSFTGDMRAFDGTITVSGGTLNMSTVGNATAISLTSAGATLGITGEGAGVELASGKSLTAVNGAVLDSALSLNGGALTLGTTAAAWALEGGLDLGGNALSLSAENKTALTLNLGDTAPGAGDTVELFTNATLAAELAANATLATYFSGVSGHLANAALSFAGGKLVATLPAILQESLTWGVVPGEGDSVTSGIWADGEIFGNEGSGTFDNGDVAVFAAISGEDTVESVVISGEVTADSVSITAGEGKTYDFTGINDGVLSTDTLEIGAGTAKFAANALNLAALTSVTIDGVLDLTGYTGEAITAPMLAMEKDTVSGTGTVRIGNGWMVFKDASVPKTLNYDIDIEAVGGFEILRNGAPETITLEIDKKLTITGNDAEFKIGRGTDVVVKDSGEVVVPGVIKLANAAVGAVAGSNLTLEAGGSIKAASIKRENTADSYASTFTMSGGTLELTGTGGIASNIATTITGGTLKAASASWGITGGTIGAASLDEGGNPVPAVKIVTTGDNTITLSGSTLASTLDNSAGKLTIAGATRIDTTSFNHTDDYTAYSNRSTGNGLATLDQYYQLSTDVGYLTIGTDATFTVGAMGEGGTFTGVEGTYISDGSWNGWVQVHGTEFGSVFFVNSGTVQYGVNSVLTDSDSTTTAADAYESIAIQGGTLQVKADLTTTAGKNIELKGTGAIDIAPNVTLAAGRISGTGTATLTGSGIYDLGDVTGVGTGNGKDIAWALHKVTLADTWTGTVSLYGDVGKTQSGPILKKFGNKGSWIEIAQDGVSGSLNQNSGDDLTIDSSLRLTGNMKIVWNYNSKTYIFANQVVGAGDIEFQTGGGMTFTGDISGWSGGFVASGTNTPVAILTLTGTTVDADGNAVTADQNLFAKDGKGVVLSHGGTLNVTMGNANNTVIMCGKIDNQGEGTLNLTTAGNVTLAADATLSTITNNNAGKTLTVDTGKTLKADSLTNNGTLTVNGTLADGAAVTNTGTITLTQDEIKLASLAGVGSVSATSTALVVSGVVTGESDIEAASIDLQGAENTTGDLIAKTGKVALAAGTNHVYGEINAADDVSIGAGECKVQGDITAKNVTIGAVHSRLGNSLTSIKASTLTLQGGLNNVKGIALTGDLTLGTADAAAQLISSGPVTIGGNVTVNKLSGGLVGDALVADVLTVQNQNGGSLTLRFDIKDSVLRDFMLDYSTNTFTLATVEKAGTLEASFLEGETTIESADQTFQYTIAVDSGVVTISREAMGTKWFGGAMYDHDDDDSTAEVARSQYWSGDDSWVGDHPSANTTVVLAGTGSEKVLFGNKDATSGIEKLPSDLICETITVDNVIIECTDAARKYEFASAEGSDWNALNINKNLMVSKGCLKVGSAVNIYSKGYTGVEASGTLEIGQNAFVRAEAGIEIAGKVMIDAWTTGGTTKNSGKLYVMDGGDVDIHAGATVTIGGNDGANGGVLAALSSDAMLDGSNDTYDYDDLAYNSNDEEGKGSDISNAGTITSTGQIVATGDMVNSGTLSQTAGELFVYGAMTNTGADIPVDGGAEKPVGMDISGGNVKVGTLTNSDTILLSGADTKLEVTGIKSVDAPAALVNSGVISITDGASLEVLKLTMTQGEYVDGSLLNEEDGVINIGDDASAASLTVNGDLTNSGGINLTQGTIDVTGNMDNTGGTLSIAGGDQGTDAEGNTIYNLNVGGDLINTDGTVSISGEGTKAHVGGDLTLNPAGTGAPGSTLTVGAATELEVEGDLSATDVTLGFDGKVTVGGTATMENLTIAQGGAFIAENATISDTLVNNGSLTVTATLVVDENGDPMPDLDGNTWYTGGNLVIGTLDGDGEVHVQEGGSLSIGNSKNFKGELDNKGTLVFNGTSDDATFSNTQYIIDGVQQTAGDVTAGTVTLTEDAQVATKDALGNVSDATLSGYKMGDVRADVLVIDGLATQAADGTVTLTEGTRLVTDSLVDKNMNLPMVKLVFSDIEDQTMTSGKACALETNIDSAFWAGFDLSNYGIINEYAAVSPEGLESATVVIGADGRMYMYVGSLDSVKSDYMQELLKQGKRVYVDITDAAANANAGIATADESTLKNIEVTVRIDELQDSERIWTVGNTLSSGGLIVLDGAGDLASDTILETIKTVQVDDSDDSIDLSGDTLTQVVLNNLTDTTEGKNAGLELSGDATDTFNVTTNGDSYATGTLMVNAGTVNLNGGKDENDNIQTGKVKLLVVAPDATANIELQGSKVSMNEKGTATFNGNMKDGQLELVKGAAIGDESTLNLDATDVKLIRDNVVTTDMVETGTLETMGKMTGSVDKVEVHSDYAGTLAGEYYKYFDMDSARLENSTIVADRNTSHYSDNYTAESANGAAGMEIADEILTEYYPQLNRDEQSELANALDAIEYAGSTTERDELAASLAGASSAALGMAVSGDVDRQLRAIRNRTTTMGVDQSVANEDMPYFNAWINAEGDRSELSESGTEGGYELSSWGGTVGFDVDFCPTLTAGMALTAMYGDLDVTGADTATGDLDSYYLSAFARYSESAWTHTFVATVGTGDISMKRTVLGSEQKVETDALSFGLMYEVGRVFALDEDGSTCLQPVFNVTWKHTTVDAYTEEGSDLALEVDEQTIDTVTFGLGARLQTVVGESMYNRTSILEARVLAKADVGDRSGSADVALAALPGAKASVDSAEMGAFGLEAGAGLTIPLGQEGGSIFMDASVELRSDYTNVNGTVGYRINF